MKKFTKFLVAMLVFALLFAVAACKKDPEPDPKPNDEMPAELKAAIDYVDGLYRNKDSVTSSDFTLIAKSTGLDVVWTVTVTKGQASDVTVTLNEAGTQYTVDVNDKSETEITYTLKATITNADGKSAFKEYSFTVPAFRELTYAEYMAAAKGDTVTIKGIVTAVIGKANGNTYNCLYLQDNDGGYYAYGLKEDPSADGDNKVTAGMTVRVTGVKDIYSGTIEVKEGAYEILDKTLKTVEAADYTAAYANAKSLKEDALVGKQAILVKVDNVTIVPEDETAAASGYYKFAVGALESYARISSSVCPLNAAQTKTFKENHKAGYTATVTGVVCVYDGAFYLTPVDENCWSNLQLPVLSDADALALEKGQLAAPATKVGDDTVINLQTAGLAYAEQVAISWASDSECAVVSADGKTLTITCPEEDTEVTLTATLTAGTETDTVTFKVNVEAAATDQYVAKKVSAMAAGTYKFAMDLTGVGKGYLYATGTLNSKGALETTDKAAKAGDFVVAAVEGKENTYTIKVGEKYLVAYRNGTYNNMKLDDNAGEWVFDATLGVFKATYSYDDNGTTKEITVYFGAYLNAKTGAIGNTMALSDVSYISGDNTAKIGVSQFPGFPSQVVLKEVEFKKASAMAAGSYKFAMDLTGVGKGYLFATGTLNSKGALETTDKMSKAGTFVVAAVEGKENTYTIKVGEKYLVAYRNGTYNNMKLDDNAGEWVFDATLGVFKATYSYDDNGTTKEITVYFGAYLNAKTGAIGNTMALSDVSYISGDNTAKIGVSQFPGFPGDMAIKAAE